MPLGGLAPLPLRLGSDAELGWSAEEHARFCADLTAVSRVSPAFMQLATLSADPAATKPLVTTWYSGRNGPGLANCIKAFASAVPNAHIWFEFATPYNEYGTLVDAFSFMTSDWCVVAMSAYFQAGGNLVPLSQTTEDVNWTENPSADDNIAIVLYSPTSVAIGDYGGHLLKRNSLTEGSSTYAWQWYQYLKRAQGSAYSTSDTSVRSWELKAQARALGTSQRISEMLAASGTPGGSDAKLGRWAAVLGIQQGVNPKWKVRRDCEQIAQLPEAPTHAYLIAALNDILSGLAIVTGIAHPSGTITAWPPGTYWPGIVNGDAAYDLGPGVFSSTRCRMTLQVTPMAQGTYTYSLGGSELEYLMSRDVARFMERIIPATADWGWETGAGAGFILDTSALDLTAL